MATYWGWGVRDTTRCETILGSTQTDSVRLKTDTNRPKVGSAYLARRPHVMVHLRLVSTCHWLSWCATKPPQACLISSWLPSAPASLSSLAHLLILEISACSSCCNSPSPPPMLVLSINLIIHKCNDLGSIKFSLTQTLDSIKSEFTCCSNNFARALVIGPILTSLAFSCTATSSSGKDGKGLGMSSSTKEGHPMRVAAHRTHLK